MRKVRMARGGRASTEEAAQTSYHRRSGPHSKRPLRPELTGEWNIPVAWEPQPAFKGHCVCVALSAFDLSLVPLPLLWGFIILGLLGEHGKFLTHFYQDHWSMGFVGVDCELLLDSQGVLHGQRFLERLRLRRTKVYLL